MGWNLSSTPLKQDMEQMMIIQTLFWLHVSSPHLQSARAANSVVELQSVFLMWLFTVYSLYTTALHSTVYTLQPTVYVVYSLQFTLSTVYSLQCTLSTAFDWSLKAGWMPGQKERNRASLSFWGARKSHGMMPSNMPSTAVCMLVILDAGQLGNLKLGICKCTENWASVNVQKTGHL